MDWDDFMKIPGCTASSHTDEKPVKPASAPLTRSEECVSAPRLVEQSSVTVAVEPEPEVVNKPDQVPFRTRAGLYRCRHAGCLQEYDPATNSEVSCEYHEGSAGFRDTKKFWTCCGASSYDWDEFMKIPKCKRGYHEPKMIDA